MFNELIAQTSGTLKRMAFSLQKNSPTILVVTGVVGVVASTVLACKATPKATKIVEEHKKTMEEVRKAPEDNPENYTKEDQQKDTILVYTQTALKLVKVYAPAITIGTASIISILASHGIMKQRNAAISAAFSLAEKSFDQYRERVIERFGKDVDKQLKYNLKAVEIEETVKDEKGKEKVVKKKIEVADPTVTGSPYVKYFTESNPNWENSTDFVETFLRMQQSCANDILRANGHLTLNQVYDMLGFHDTKAGMVVGWIYDTKHPTGDNYVEFDVKKVYIVKEDGGYEETLAIDFNVDGNIYDKMI